MTTHLTIELHWGRYHATPWDRHVNEGAVEWPPSPWRVVRALYAVWKTRAPELDEHTVLGLLGRLSTAPSVRLPAHSTASTRHYYPDEKHRSMAEPGGTTDKIIDGWLVTARDARIELRWPEVELSPDEQAAFDTLADRLTYLGRADSVCSASTETAADTSAGDWSEPLPDEAGVGERRLGFAEPPGADVIEVTTDHLRSQRRLVPPSTTWVRYRMPAEVPQTTVPTKRRRPSPTAVRWVLNSNALPSVRRTLWVADRFRAAAASQYGNVTRGAGSATILGKDATGKALEENHRHAHWIPLDEDGDGLIDHLVAWAPAGFTADEVDALERISRIWSGRDDRRIKATVGLELVGDVSAALPDHVVATTRWVTQTPVTFLRHQKRNQPRTEFVTAEVHRELRFAGIDAAARIELIDDEAWVRYERCRFAESRAMARRGAEVRVTFGDAVGGPLLLGHHRHFGMGLLRPGV